MFRKILVPTDGSSHSLASARAQGCDLIVMGSHGLGGVQKLLLGSETTKVLAHARIPVLVVR